MVGKRRKEKGRETKIRLFAASGFIPALETLPRSDQFSVLPYPNLACPAIFALPPILRRPSTRPYAGLRTAKLVDASFCRSLFAIALVAAHATHLSLSLPLLLPFIDMASGSPTSEQVHNAFQSCRFGADEFLRTGVPISHRFTYDYLPIHYAAIEGRECLVRYSLENRIDPNSSTCYGSTALHFAAREGRLEIARLLLNHGADVNARDFNNATPLHYAVAEQRTELMELLIDYGANKRAENVRRTTLSPAFIHSSRTHLRAIPHDSSSTKRRSTSPGTTNIATFSSLAVRRHALDSSIHPCVRRTDAYRRCQPPSGRPPRTATSRNTCATPSKNST